MNKILAMISAALGVALLGGCNTYTVVQRNVFVDEAGNVVEVDYGRGDSDHVNYFKSPVNGEEMEFKSRLVIRVCLPDGDHETAWQCMNFAGSGTMYKTDNEKWMFQASGFTFFIYKQGKRDPTKYRQVFCGVLCDSPDIGVERDKKWKVIRPQQTNVKKGGKNSESAR